VKQAVGTSGQGLNRLGDLLWRRKPGYTAVDVSLHMLDAIPALGHICCHRFISHVVSLLQLQYHDHDIDMLTLAHCSCRTRSTSSRQFGCPATRSIYSL
jgi:hypothetical protein